MGESLSRHIGGVLTGAAVLFMLAMPASDASSAQVYEIGCRFVVTMREHPGQASIKIHSERPAGCAQPARDARITAHDERGIPGQIMDRVDPPPCPIGRPIATPVGGVVDADLVPRRSGLFYQYTINVARLCLLEDPGTPPR